MKLKNFLLRIAAFAAAFVFGIGFLGGGQYLQSFFEAEAPKAETSEPALKQETLFFPPRVEETTAPAADCAETGEPEFEGFGDYYIAGDKPKGFKDFEEMSIVTRDYETATDEVNGIPIPPEGYVVARASVKYKLARIRIGNKQIAFETEAKKGISYKFAGKLLDEPEYDETTDSRIMITGRLVKMRDGKKIAESEVRFAADNSCSC